MTLTFEQARDRYGLEQAIAMIGEKMPDNALEFFSLEELIHLHHKTKEANPEAARKIKELIDSQNFTDTQVFEAAYKCGTYTEPIMARLSRAEGSLEQWREILWRHGDTKDYESLVLGKMLPLAEKENTVKGWQMLYYRVPQEQRADIEQKMYAAAKTIWDWFEIMTFPNDCDGNHIEDHQMVRRAFEEMANFPSDNQTLGCWSQLWQVVSYNGRGFRLALKKISQTTASFDEVMKIFHDPMFAGDKVAWTYIKVLLAKAKTPEDYELLANKLYIRQGYERPAKQAIVKVAEAAKSFEDWLTIYHWLTDNFSRVKNVDLEEKALTAMKALAQTFNHWYTIYYQAEQGKHQGVCDEAFAKMQAFELSEDQVTSWIKDAQRTNDRVYTMLISKARKAAGASA